MQALAQMHARGYIHGNVTAANASLSKALAASSS